MQEASSLPWAALPQPAGELVRSSCEALLIDNPHVRIDEAVLLRYAREMDASKLQTQRRQYPLVFPTPRSEINFLCTLAYLQIGSGWRRALHAQRGGKGAAETMTFGCIGMHISGELTARTFVGLKLFDVAQLFGLKIQEDFELRPGIHSERPTELYSLAEALHKLLRDAGQTLLNLACEDWADFFEKVNPGTGKLREIDAQTGKPKQASAEQTVARLVRHFTGLQDAYILPPRKQQQEATPATAAETKAAATETTEAAASSSATSESGAASASPAAAPAAASASSPRVVYVLKKAQLIVAELYLRFGVDDPESPFCFHDITSLTVMSDNVLPAVLRAHGVLVYSDELAALVDGNTKITNREMEASMRAAAVVACERIVKEYNTSHNVVHTAPGCAKKAQESSAAASGEGAAAEAAAGKAGPALTALNIDYHLWLSGKNPDLRGLARHATHSIYY